MAVSRLPRLLAGAKEFNIGQDTLIEFLVGKGFNKDELKPTAKLTEEQYKALQEEFHSDKVAKTKADKIEIPKSTIAPQAEKKKKESEVAADETEPVIEKQEAVPTQISEEKKEPKKPIVPQKEIPVVEEIPAEKIIEQAKPKIEEEIIVPQNEVKIVEEPEDKIKIKGPKILDKIDLSTIDFSTRPKKTAKPKKTETKDAAAKTQVQQQKVKKKETKKTEQKPIIDPSKQKKQKEEVVVSPPPVIEKKPIVAIPPVIENIHVEKIEGPKILGKIALPVDNDTRPKQSGKAGGGRKKRKRIPIDTKKVGGMGAGADNRKGKPQPHTDFRRDNRPAGGGAHQKGRPAHGRFAAEIEKEIDQKRIQEKIKETQAKLSGAAGSKTKTKARYRREKRHEMAEAMETMENQENNVLQLTEFITVSELANLMDVSFADIISKCMGLGIMVSINQRLDAEVIELVAEEFGYKVEFIGLEDSEHIEEEKDDESLLQPRYPIVTIMGHVDHGKTSLLDYIRRTKVASGEAGGITQHIGAYVVNVGNGKKITFLDTPGHEAFTAMRARGAKVTDIAVIVIAADDAVMPQTREAISHAQAAGVPMIFAINKIDKEGANAQKIYEQLSQMNLLVEEWGGKYQSQEISAKQGLNVDLLLEKILLEAEVLNLKANPNKEATGSVIEASLDKGRGYVATLLVQNGTLHQGDLVVAGQYFGRMKAMFNELNQRIDIAEPSTPVQVLGLNGAPQAGEKIKVYTDEAEAKEIANKRVQILREQGLRTRKHITLDEIGRRLALGNFKQLNIIIKGDVDGSVEALSDALQKISTEEIMVSVVHKAVGQISESDVLLATASDAIIIGFNVRASSQAAKLAVSEGVQIKSYSIIYNAIEEVKSAMEGMLEPKVEEKEVATIEVREVYKFDKATVAGCYVLEGKVKREHKIRLFRDGILVYPRQEGAYAELGSLKRFKDDVKEVAQNFECGLTLKNFTDIQVGDNIVAYEEQEVKRTL